MDGKQVCARHGGKVTGFETPKECRAKTTYTCPSCAEGDHRNCTRLTCVCVCDGAGRPPHVDTSDEMKTAQGYLWKQRAQTNADVLRETMVDLKNREIENQQLRQLCEQARRHLVEIVPDPCNCVGAKACDLHELIADLGEGRATDLIASVAQIPSKAICARCGGGVEDHPNDAARCESCGEPAPCPDDDGPAMFTSEGVWHVDCADRPFGR